MGLSKGKLIGWSIAGAAVVGTGIGLFYFGRSQFRDLRERSAERDGLEYGSAANHAKRLKMAFDNDNTFGWGTNEEEVYTVFRELPTQRAYNQVQKEYNKLYQTELNRDLQDELDVSEYRQVLSILASKPQ